MISFALLGTMYSQAQSSEDATEEILSAMSNRMTVQRNAWFGHGQYPVIAHSLEYTLMIEFNDYERVTDLGWMYGNMEMKDKQIALYEKYRSDFPNDPDASFPAAMFYFQTREYAKIPPILEPSLKLPTQPHANSYTLLANSYDRLKQYKDSLRIWNVYLKLYPNDEAAIRNRNKVQELAKKDGDGS